MHKHALVCALLFALAPCAAFAATPEQPVDELPKVAKADEWVMQGGSVNLRFNVDRLSAQGVEVIPGVGMKADNPNFNVEIEFPLLQGGGLRFAAPKGNFQQFTGGKVMGRDGFKVRTMAGLELDFSRFELRTDPNNPLNLLLVGTDGEPWFYVNHLMYKLVDDHQSYYIRSADINATAAFADRVGAPSLAGAYIGELKMLSPIVQRPAGFKPADPKAITGGPNFHGSNGYQADVLLTSYTMQFARCRTSGGTNGCDGPTGDDGEVVFVPSSTLRNTNTANTADVPWYEKFSVSPYNYPYTNNDQHPYLIWNLYRVNDGQLQQIGASGVKHAFLTTNVGCGNVFGNHILSPNCSDTYGTGNNDATNDLGPRNEIVPATGRWGRCFSIFDTNCDGNENGVGSSQYQNRMISRESQLALAGSTFFTDSWYVIQDDVNIFNTMGHRTATLSHSGSAWSIATQGAFTLGPVIDSWVNPTTNPTQNVLLKTGEGNIKVAVKVKTLDACPAGSGLSGTCYRYDYAVHNFDLARAVLNTSPPANAGANLQVISNKGVVSFSIPRGGDAGVHLDTGHFADIDITSGNDWTGAVSAGAATWTAPAGNELNWGTLFRFSLVTTIAPDPAFTRSVTFGMPAAGGPSSYTIDLMVPNTFGLFDDGFETGILSR